MTADQLEELIAWHRSRITNKLPAAEIHLTGSASVVGLSAEDVDLVVLVEEVLAAAAELRDMYRPLYDDQWSDTWAAFRDPGLPQVDLVLTKRGTKWDAHHRLAWYLLRRDSELRDEYAALKEEPQDYAQRKAAFFEAVVGLLPVDAEQVLGGHPARWPKRGVSRRSELR